MQREFDQLKNQPGGQIGWLADFDIQEVLTHFDQESPNVERRSFNKDLSLSGIWALDQDQFVGMKEYLHEELLALFQSPARWRNLQHLYLPVHYNAHWLVVYVDRRTENCNIWFLSSKSGYADKFPLIFERMKAKFLEFDQVAAESRHYQLRSDVQNFPQQAKGDDYSCGIFLCEYFKILFQNEQNPQPVNEIRVQRHLNLTQFRAEWAQKIDDKYGVTSNLIPRIQVVYL